jgi:DHA1 family bicyclomycin/chloramphenicol resistance-like MFS transporter
MASFFAFLASSSFIYIDHYGLTPTQYSFAFSMNAVGFIGMSQFTANFARRFGFPALMRVASAGYFAITVTLLALFMLGFDQLWIMMAFLFVGFACLGLIIPSSAVLALDDHGEIAGSASALMGTFQMVTGAVVMAIVSAFFDGTAVPMLAGIAICATIVLVLIRGTLGTRQTVPA